MKIDNEYIVNEVITEFPELKRHEQLVYELVKKISLVYGVALYGKNPE